MPFLGLFGQFFLLLLLVFLELQCVLARHGRDSGSPLPLVLLLQALIVLLRIDICILVLERFQDCLLLLEQAVLLHLIG